MTQAARLRSFVAAGPAGLGLLLGTLLVHLPTLGQPLLEVHAWRQTQTAWTALLYHEHGIDLLRPMIPTFGPPFVVPFEFPLFQALASILMDAGVPPDPAMRAIGLTTFLLSAALVWRLAARLAGEPGGLVALLAFLFTPLGLLWSRTSMIEYLAAAGAVGYLLATLVWLERGSWVWYGAAILAGAVAMLVKAPTGGLYVLLIIALGVERWRGRSSTRPFGRRDLLLLVVLVAVPLVLGVAWTAYADAVKSAAPFTAGLTANALREHYFGTLAQRLDLGQWAAFLGRTNDLLLGGAGWLWIPLGLVAAALQPRRLVLLALAAGAFIGPLVFTNLYFVHDYYLAAVSPIAAVGMGVAGAWLWSQRTAVLPRVIAASLVAVWVLTVVGQRHYWLAQFHGVVDPEQVLPAAADIAAGSRPDEFVVVTGRYFSPAVLYYARREGLLIWGNPDEALAEALGPDLPQLRALGYRTLFHCPLGPPNGCERVIDLAGYVSTVMP